MASRLVARALRARLRPVTPLLVSSCVHPPSQTRSLATSLARGDDFQQLADQATEEKEKKREGADREERIKEELLDCALDHVAAHGWTREAVRAAAEQLGHPSVVAGVVGGGGELVIHHIRSSNRRLDSWMESEVEAQKVKDGRVKVGKFVREAVVRRLQMNSDHMRSGRWAEAVVLASSPGQAGQALEAMQELCDDVWFRAGDTATDYNW